LEPCAPGSSCTFVMPPRTEGSESTSVMCECTPRRTWCCGLGCEQTGGTAGEGATGATAGTGAGGGTGASGGTGPLGGTGPFGGTGPTGGTTNTGGNDAGDSSDAGFDASCTPQAPDRGIPCGTANCDADQICVAPCCGGPPIDGGCTPPPPYCVNASEITCPRCDSNCRDRAGCFGMLRGRLLSCQCA
jgi:hypothetical protein